MSKLNDLPLSETIKHIESVIFEYEEELHRPENADIRTRIYDAQKECRDLLKELNALKDMEVFTTKVSHYWRLAPVLLTTNPPKNIWVCKYCGNRLIMDVSEMPNKPCTCQKIGNES